ncbi:MAG: hypothetical protein ACT4PP_17055 [Sporichthyaceae bacterium]
MSTLRRLPVRWLLPVFFAVDLALAYARGPEQWRGSWMTTITWNFGTLVLLGPLAAGLAATTASWQRRVFTESAAAAITRPRWITTGFGTLACWVVALHALTVTQALVLTATLNPRPDWGALVGLPMQLLVLTGFLAAGWLVGQYLPTAISGLAAASGAFAVQVYQGPIPESMVDLGSGSSDLTDLAYVNRALLTWVLFSSAVVLAAIAAPTWRKRPGSARLGALAGAAVLGLGAVSSAQAVDNVLESPPIPMNCKTAGEVQVCMASTLEFARDDITAAIGEVIALQRGLGVQNKPQTVIQIGAQLDLPPGFSPGPPLRPFYLTPSGTTDKALLHREMTRYLLADHYHCQLDSRRAGFEMEPAVLTSLQQRLGAFQVERGSDEPVSAGSGLRGAGLLSDADLRDALDAFATCDGAAVDRIAERVFGPSRFGG